MKKNLFIITILLAVFALTVPWAVAQDKEKPCPMKSMKHGMRAAGIPDLTEDQQKQIEKLKTDLDKAILPLESQLDVKSAELKNLMIADNPNIAAVNAKLDEIGGLRTQIQKRRVTNQLEIRKLLTPEQRIAFDKRTLKRFDRAGMKFQCGPEMGQRVRMMIRKRLGDCGALENEDQEEMIELKKE